MAWNTPPYGGRREYCGHGFVTADGGLLLWNGAYPCQSEYNPEPFEVTKWNAGGTINWYIDDVNDQAAKPGSSTNDNPRAQPARWAAFPTNDGGAAFWLRRSSTHYGYIGSGLWWGLYLIDGSGNITLVELLGDLAGISTVADWTVGCQLTTDTIVLMACEYYAQSAGNPWCEIQMRSSTGTLLGYENLSESSLGTYRGRSFAGCAGPDGEFYFAYWLQDSSSQYQFRVARYDEGASGSISETWDVDITGFGFSFPENKLFVTPDGSLYVFRGYVDRFLVLDGQTGDQIDLHIPAASTFIDPYQLGADGFANTW